MSFQQQELITPSALAFVVSVLIYKGLVVYDGKGRPQCHSDNNSSSTSQEAPSHPSKFFPTPLRSQTSSAADREYFYEQRLRGRTSFGDAKDLEVDGELTNRVRLESTSGVDLEGGNHFDSDDEGNSISDRIRQNNDKKKTDDKNNKQSRQSQSPARSPRHFARSRANFNSLIMPSRVILVRHGQSEGNADSSIYSTKPDPDLALTRRGWEQVIASGKALRGLLGEGESKHFVVSPYVRTMETFHGLLSAWENPQENGSDYDPKVWYQLLNEKHDITFHEDPRIREQDYGNYQNEERMKGFKRERNRYGPFYYRFPDGESASDVFDRVSTFLDSLWRSFEAMKSRNYVIVTHGAAIRVLLTRYFRYTVDEYNKLSNPTNGEIISLCHDGKGKLKLEGRMELREKGGEEGGWEYDWHKSLKVWTKEKPKRREVKLSSPFK